jgi:hypothetical protein
MFYQPTSRHIPIESKIRRRHRRGNSKSHATNSKHVSLPGFLEDNEKKGENLSENFTKNFCELCVLYVKNILIYNERIFTILM